MEESKSGAKVGKRMTRSSTEVALPKERPSGKNRQRQNTNYKTILLQRQKRVSVIWTTPGTPILRTFEGDLGCRGL